MTQEQKTELDILLDIVFEASKWKIEDGQDGIRLEVESRIRNLILTDKETVVSCQPEVSPVLTADDFNALEAARLNEHLASPDSMNKKLTKWKHGRVRVTIDGKLVWKLESECHKEIIPGFEKKWHWVWNGPEEKPVAEVCQPVDKLSDELWAAHEKGEE